MTSFVGETEAPDDGPTRPGWANDVPPGRWVVDPGRSRIGFTARHLLVSRIRGRFLGVAGTIVVGGDPTDSSVEASAEASTITTGDPDRDEHLRSPDFLDAVRWPTLTLRGTGLQPWADGYVLDAELTIRDVTRTVRVTVVLREPVPGPRRTPCPSPARPGWTGGNSV